MILILSNMRE